MRKVIVSNLITLDSLIGGLHGEIDWFTVNDEFFQFATEQLHEVDTLLFGRITYQGMADYWTSPGAMQDDPVITRLMNEKQKVVFSKTLDRAGWTNTTLASGDLGTEIARLKQQPGKDMVIFGSGQIVSALTELGLIDEYRLFLNPVILGSGQPEFQGLTHMVRLKLIKAATYQTGVVVLFYEPIRE